jgi:hypothetical protein
MWFSVAVKAVTNPGRMDSDAGRRLTFETVAVLPLTPA